MLNLTNEPNSTLNAINNKDPDSTRHKLMNMNKVAPFSSEEQHTLKNKDAN